MGKNILAAIGVTIGTILSSSFPKGYEDYTVQKEQYFVEFACLAGFGLFLEMIVPVYAGRLPIWLKKYKKKKTKKHLHLPQTSCILSSAVA